MVHYPAFYDPSRIGTLFYPDMAAIAADAAAAKLPSAATDKQDIHLVIIDMQIDFCHDNGGLNVPGSLGDIRRLIEFIFHNAERISRITCSLDSHVPQQIFFPNWWADENGNHPVPFTLISYADIRNGKWRPLLDPAGSTSYVKTLEEQAKKVLTIWPYHTLIGSIGHALDPELWSVVKWHSLARNSQPTWLTKGSVPQTEHYSAVQPEVPIPGHPLGGKNQAFMDTLEAADLVIIAGEAESHCVLETLEDIVEDFGDRPEALAKVYLLSDCTSPVIHPDIDFHAIALARFKEFEAQGVNFIRSSDILPTQVG